MKKTILLLAVIITLTSFTQAANNDFEIDDIKTMSKTEFNNLNSTLLLQKLYNYTFGTELKNDTIIKNNITIFSPISYMIDKTNPNKKYVFSITPVRTHTNNAKKLINISESYFENTNYTNISNFFGLKTKLKREDFNFSILIYNELVDIKYPTAYTLNKSVNEQYLASFAYYLYEDKILNEALQESGRLETQILKKMVDETRFKFNQYYLDKYELVGSTFWTAFLDKQTSERIPYCTEYFKDKTLKSQNPGLNLELETAKLVKEKYELVIKNLTTEIYKRIDELDEEGLKNPQTKQQNATKNDMENLVLKKKGWEENLKFYETYIIQETARVKTEYDQGKVRKAKVRPGKEKTTLTPIEEELLRACLKTEVTNLGFEINKTTLKMFENTPSSQYQKLTVRLLNASSQNINPIIFNTLEFDRDQLSMKLLMKKYFQTITGINMTDLHLIIGNSNNQNNTKTIYLANTNKKNTTIKGLTLTTDADIISIILMSNTSANKTRIGSQCTIDSKKTLDELNKNYNNMYKSENEGILCLLIEDNQQSKLTLYFNGSLHFKIDKDKLVKEEEKLKITSGKYSELKIANITEINGNKVNIQAKKVVVKTENKKTERIDEGVTDGNEEEDIVIIPVKKALNLTKECIQYPDLRMQVCELARLQKIINKETSGTAPWSEAVENRTKIYDDLSSDKRNIVLSKPLGKDYEKFWQEACDESNEQNKNVDSTTSENGVVEVISTGVGNVDGTDNQDEKEEDDNSAESNPTETPSTPLNMGKAYPVTSKGIKIYFFRNTSGWYYSDNEKPNQVCKVNSNCKCNILYLSISINARPEFCELIKTLDLLGTPDEKGIYTYKAGWLITSIYYKFSDNNWTWSPDKKVWMNSSTLTVKEGKYKDSRLVKANIKIIHLLNAMETGKFNNYNFAVLSDSSIRKEESRLEYTISELIQEVPFEFTTLSLEYAQFYS